MLSPKDFIARWGNDGARLIRFPELCVQRLTLSEGDKGFLLEAGLPEDAAPFLTFEGPKSGELPTVAEKWGLAKEFARYRMIGFDGSGNPIALDDAHHGEVVFLDHENRFARVLMNTSIRQLAASLLAYRKLIQETEMESGQDAFLDGKISLAAREELRQTLAANDPAAMQPGCFWHGELQNLNANAG